MKPANPYNYNLPTPPEMFYGRRAELDQLLTDLSATPGDSHAVIGGRRMGKTSLLEALMGSLGETQPNASFLLVPIFMDFTGDRIRSALEFFRTAAEKSVCELSVLINAPGNNSALTPPRFDENTPPAPLLARFLVAWERLVIQQSGRRLRMVLLLDECELLTHQVWSSDLYNSLRYLLTHFTTRSILKMAMAGSHRFLTAVNQDASPLQNILKYTVLYALSHDESRALITDPTKAALSADVVQEVLAQSGGHPFLTQYLMHHLWEAGLESASPSKTKRLAKNFPLQRQDFQDWLETMGSSSQQIYHVLAQAARPLSEARIGDLLPEPLLDYVQALEALRYHGLVERVEGERYAASAAMFRNWFESQQARRIEKMVFEDLRLSDTPIDMGSGNLPPAMLSFPAATSQLYVCFLHVDVPDGVNLTARLSLVGRKRAITSVHHTYHSETPDGLVPDGSDALLLTIPGGALDPGSYRVRLVADNKPIGQVEFTVAPVLSEMRSIKTDLEIRLPAHHPIRQRWALLVGINRYKDPNFPALKYCVSDVEALADSLEQLGYTVVLLHDRLRDETRKPTRDNLEAALERLRQSAQEDDLILVHFAGHGHLVDGQPVLITQEILQPLLARRALPVAQVESILRQGECRRIVFLLDACHTGLKMGRSLTDPQFIRNVYELAEGFALIAASTSQQLAQEWDARAHGVFTYYLLEGLSGEADMQGKGFVTVSDLTNFVLDRLRRWYVEHQGRIQEPTARVEGLGDMILADYRS